MFNPKNLLNPQKLIKIKFVAQHLNLMYKKSSVEITTPGLLTQGLKKTYFGGGTLYRHKYVLIFSD